jgi:hypothetical protein
MPRPVRAEPAAKASPRATQNASSPRPSPRLPPRVARRPRSASPQRSSRWPPSRRAEASSPQPRSERSSPTQTRSNATAISAAGSDRVASACPSDPRPLTRPDHQPDALSLTRARRVSHFQQNARSACCETRGANCLPRRVLCGGRVWLRARGSTSLSIRIRRERRSRRCGAAATRPRRVRGRCRSDAVLDWIRSPARRDQGSVWALVGER